MDLNLVVLAGTVDDEPSLDTLPSGKTMAIMDIEVCRPIDGSKHTTTDVITIAIHNPDPDHQMFKPDVVGKRVWVAGYIKVLCNNPFKKDGERHEHMNVVVAEDLAITDKEESDGETA